MTGEEMDRKVLAYTDDELKAAVFRWFEQAVDAFEGAPGPSENEGKRLVTEMLERGWGP